MKILIIGPSKKFTSGISYYTTHLANAMNKEFPTSVVTLRNLLPKFLFPGANRVGKNITSLEFNKKIKIYDGIDWFWIPSIFKAFNFIKKENPDVIILQWWTSSVAHTYYAIKKMNDIFWKKKLIFEFHETIDQLEDKNAFLRFYVKFMAKRLFNNKDDYTIHSNSDKEIISKRFKLSKEKIVIVPHGSYDHFVNKINVKKEKGVCNLLFFGLIRPYKGVEYLIKAFNSIPEKEIKRFRLYIVGETWEGYDLRKIIKTSKYKDKIDFVNRYVSDEEVRKYFSLADIVVLPYLRASQSGPAHIAMSQGLSIICSEVGGLKDNLKDYRGIRFVKPKNTNQLKEEILKSYKNKDKRFEDSASWDKTLEKYKEVLEK